MPEIIFKYKINLGPNEHVLPVGARVVHFAVDPKTNTLQAWIAHAPTDHGTPMSLQQFLVVATGQGYENDRWRHSFTTLTEEGLAWHLLTEKIPGSGKRVQTDRSHSYASQ